MTPESPEASVATDVSSEYYDLARNYFSELQDRICGEIQKRETRARFREDLWSYEPDENRRGEGGGRSRVIAGGSAFEKGGVNLADVTGELTGKIAERLKIEPQPFRATGISLVIHPLSPRVPTVHMNLRFLALKETCWFGGGADLTPYYLDDEDVRHFHKTLKRACDAHPGYDYSEYKAWCDRYFFNHHRKESRGIGGLFFDYLKQDPQKTFAFVQEVGNAFLEAYLPIVDRHLDDPWWDAQREWQLIRRGRYVEFNLIHDRGTLFGLETGGRTESILMSLPPLVRWAYDHRPEPGSEEERLLEVLREPRDWA